MIFSMSIPLDTKLYPNSSADEIFDSLRVFIQSGVMLFWVTRNSLNSPSSETRYWTRR